MQNVCSRPNVHRFVSENIPSRALHVYVRNIPAVFTTTNVRRKGLCVCVCVCVRVRVCVCARSQLKCCAEAVTRFAPLLPGSFSLTNVLHYLLFRLPCFEQRHACWVCPVAEAEPDAAARCPLPTEHRHKRPSGKACACHAKANLCVHRPARQRAGRAWKGVRGGANI